MTRECVGDPPSPFVERLDRSELGAARTAPPRALDVAMGRGRHARAARARGLRDVRRRPQRSTRCDDATRGSATAASRWCADLTRLSAAPRALRSRSSSRRYLQRDLFAAIARRRGAGGVRDLRDVHGRTARARRGPTSPDHLLEPGELRERFAGSTVLFYEEVSTPEAVARIAARGRGVERTRGRGDRICARLQPIEGVARQRHAAWLRRAVRRVAVIVGAAGHATCRWRRRAEIARGGAVVVIGVVRLDRVEPAADERRQSTRRAAAGPGCASDAMPPAS